VKTHRGHVKIIALALLALNAALLLVTRARAPRGPSRPVTGARATASPSGDVLPQGFSSSFSSPGRMVVVETPPAVAAKSIRFARSADLKHWNKLDNVVPNASTPQLIWHGSQLLLLYADANHIFSRNVQPSADGGLDLDSKKPLVIKDEYAVVQVDPDMVALPNGGYRLYYTSFHVGGLILAEAQTEIHSAIERDGRWVREEGYRVAGLAFVDPDIVRLPAPSTPSPHPSRAEPPAKAGWRLFFTMASLGKVGSAVSQDGLKFEVEPGSRMNSQVTQTTQLDDGTYLMAYQKFGGQYIQHLIEVARSTDGLHMEPLGEFHWEETPVMVESPTIVKLTDGTYLMAYVTVNIQPARALPSKRADDRPQGRP